MKLKVYVDVFGRVAVCEKFRVMFEDGTEDYEGTDYFNELLKTLVIDEDFYGDRYEDLESGYYIATMRVDNELSIDYDGECADEPYMQIDKMEAITFNIDNLIQGKGGNNG